MPSAHFVATPGQSSPSFPNQNPFRFRGLLQHLLPMQRVRDLYNRAQQPVNRSLMENILSEMEVKYEITNADLTRIPKEGPVVVVANHPFGILDGAILGALLTRVRPDVKIITNYLLSGISELHEHCIFVDPFGSPESVTANRRALRKAIEWLRGGGMLAMFPAGEVSHFQLREMEVADSQWNTTVARLISMTDVPALPMFFRGRNSVPFQTMGLVHPQLRTAWLFNEFLQQKGWKVEVRTGSLISADSIRKARSPQEAARYLRWRTYLLAQRGTSHWQVPPALKSVLPSRRQEAIAETVPQRALVQDIEQLPPAQCLDENREYAVYIAEAHQAPSLMQEIGRLREITFRAAGEGSGRASDLDRFDSYYKHVLLWSKENQELVGAYRLGLTDQILPLKGIDGLYTNTLFRYDCQLFDRFGPALELGRSFVRPEYQRQYTPLLMLWKGIGRFLTQHPEIAILFGAVSVSSRYNRVSRELIVRYFQSLEDGGGIASLVTPRRPFRLRSKASADCGNVADIHDLPIADVESDRKGVPILLKHYAKLGGRILSFNVDRQFSDVLDGLVFVDLRRTSPAVLERYMGRAGVQAFHQFHLKSFYLVPA